MSEPLTEQDTDAAADALVAWCKTQSLAPADAGIVFSKVIAACLVEKSSDIKELQTAINIFRTNLIMDVAFRLRQTAGKQ